MVKFKPNLRALREVKHQETGRKITLYAIGKASGISAPTLRRWNDEEELTTIDAGVVAGLMGYFGCALDDLVRVVEDTEPA